MGSTDFYKTRVLHVMFDLRRERERERKWITLLNPGWMQNGGKFQLLQLPDSIPYRWHLFHLHSQFCLHWDKLMERGTRRPAPTRTISITNFLCFLWTNLDRLRKGWWEDLLQLEGDDLIGYIDLGISINGLPWEASSMSWKITETWRNK